MNVFRGKLSLSEILPYPKALDKNAIDSLSELVAPVEKFFANEHDPSLSDANCEFSESVIASLKDLGAFGLQVPEDLNGVGLNNTQYARTVKIVGKSDLALGVLLGAHQGIGYKGILMYGTDAQKKKYLPDLASGKNIAAYCLTEPGSGSDAASIKTRAVPTDDSKYYVLNGNKIWISNGGLADIFTVFAKVPTKTETGEIVDKMSAFIVERSFGGITNSSSDKKMGIKACNTVSLYFEDCKVPAENLLGNVGEGFKIAVNILNQGRFAMSAILSGTMQELIKRTVEFATQRKQFDRTIDQFGAIQEKIALMTMRHYITEAMTFMVSGTMDLGAKDFQLEAAISKIYSSEAAWLCVDEAIQIHAGMGYMKETGLERIMRDLRIFRIFEGANDTLRLFVALTGLQYSGKHLQASASGAVDAILNRVKVVLKMSNSAKELQGILGDQFSGSAIQLARSIDLFGLVVTDLLIRHKKGIVEHQFQLIRMAEAVIHIYAMVCALSRASAAFKENSPTANHEATLAKLACNYSFLYIRRLLEEVMSKSQSESFDIMRTISQEVCSNKGVISVSPVGF